MQLSEQELCKIGFEFIKGMIEYKVNKDLYLQWYQDEEFITVYKDDEWTQMTNVNTIEKTKELIKELCKEK
jgi:hypothetical protein